MSGGTVDGPRTIRAALLEAIAELQHDANAYATTIDAATVAEVAYRKAARELNEAEEELKSGMIVRGVPGTNEAARTAIIKLELARDPVVTERREAAERLADVKTKADAEARKWDVYQKASRAKVFALTALVARD